VERNREGREGGKEGGGDGEVQWGRNFKEDVRANNRRARRVIRDKRTIR
jgi:hypothetical protein